MTITSDKVAYYVRAGLNEYEIARWLINCAIGKHVPIKLDDLSDNGIVMDEVEAIVECIQQKDFQDAINISEDSAIMILQEEGFDVQEDS